MLLIIGDTASKEPLPEPYLRIHGMGVFALPAGDHGRCTRCRANKAGHAWILQTDQIAIDCSVDPRQEPVRA